MTEVEQKMRNLDQMDTDTRADLWLKLACEIYWHKEQACKEGESVWYGNGEIFIDGDESDKGEFKPYGSPSDYYTQYAAAGIAYACGDIEAAEILDQLGNDNPENLKNR